MAEFKFESEIHGNVLLFRTQGYIDNKAGAEFALSIRKTLGADHNRVVFNFSGSPIINSSGMAAVVEIVSVLLDEREGKIGVCGISNLVKATMNSIGLFSMITEFPDETKAIVTLNQGS
jgi:anti-anti-sigma factor